MARPILTERIIFETLPSNQLELARCGWNPTAWDISPTNLTNQQDVVRNERRQSIENSPYGIVEEAVFHMLFPKTHPYHADVMGSHTDIQAAKLEDVRNFFKLYYAPNNASLAIVGDFDPAQAKQWVRKYFGPLKRGAPVPKIAAVTPPITSEHRAVIHDQVELPRVYMAWLTSSDIPNRAMRTRISRLKFWAEGSPAACTKTCLRKANCFGCQRIAAIAGPWIDF